MLLPIRARARNRNRNRQSRITLILVFLIVSFALGGCARNTPRDRRVLIMDFESTLSEPGIPDGPAIAELMQAELINKPRVTMSTRQELKPLMQKALSRQMSPAELGSRAGVDYLVIGSMTRVNNNYVLNAHLFSVDTGEIVKNSSITRACKQERDIYPLIQAVARTSASQLKLLAEMHDRADRGEPIQAPASATEAQK